MKLATEHSGVACLHGTDDCGYSHTSGSAKDQCQIKPGSNFQHLPPLLIPILEFRILKYFPLESLDFKPKLRPYTISLFFMDRGLK